MNKGASVNLAIGDRKKFSVEFLAEQSGPPQKTCWIGGEVVQGRLLRLQPRRLHKPNTFQWEEHIEIDKLAEIRLKKLRKDAGAGRAWSED